MGVASAFEMGMWIMNSVWATIVGMFSDEIPGIWTTVSIVVLMTSDCNTVTYEEFQGTIQTESARCSASDRPSWS